ncbi:MAG: hypothetical protein IJZ36_00220, partial [Bacilli bacterium]|nr:hypothetical protein [Bacilli bacterium]
YKRGTNNVLRSLSDWVHEGEIVYRASDGAILQPFNSGDKVFTKEMSDNLWNIAKNNFEPQIPKIGLGNLENRNVSNINVGDVQYSIILPDVTKPEEFADKFKEIFDKDIGNIRKMIDTSVHSKYGSMEYRKYL